MDLTDQLDREMIPLIEEKIEAFNQGLKETFLTKVASPPEAGPAIALAVLTEDFLEVSGQFRIWSAWKTPARSRICCSATGTAALSPFVRLHVGNETLAGALPDNDGMANR